MSASANVTKPAKNAPIRGTVPSGNTVVLGVIAVAAIIALAILSWTEVLGEYATLAVSDLGSVAVNTAAAIVIIKVALSFGRKEPVSRPWLLIGIGVALFAAGDMVWAYMDLVAEIDPYPSLADVFYFAVYGFILAGIVSAAHGYRGLVDMKRPLVFAVLVSLAGTAAVYITLLAPYILPAGADELEPLAKFVSVAYPVLDVILVLGPAIFIALVVAQLGRGRIAWPWWCVALGAVLYAGADAWYSYADWSGTYETYFAIIDSGWMGANVLFMVAVLLARDVFHS